MRRAASLVGAGGGPLIGAANPALKVSSRTSVMQYRSTTKTTRQIGEELGVAFVLKGCVRRAGKRRPFS